VVNLPGPCAMASVPSPISSAIGPAASRASFARWVKAAVTARLWHAAPGAEPVLAIVQEWSRPRCARLRWSAFLIARRKDPPTRGCKLLDAGLYLGLEPGVGGGELGRGGHRLQQARVLQHGWVVDQDGNRLAVALHDGH
jgi:hypothetical protein